MMKTLRIFSLLLLMVLVPCLSASAVEVYQTQPCIRWGDWTVGQSEGSGNTVATTFITNSEKTACVKVDVKYCASQPSGYVYPIERFDFQITMNNGFNVRKEVEYSSGPAASEFSTNTTFSVDAMLEGPADTTGVKRCDGKNGRGNTPMEVTVEFIGYYGSASENLQTVTLTKKWTQDTIDMLRQEYVDMTPTNGRAELPVPDRGEFVSELSSNGVDDWDTGHYGYMIDVGLKAKKAAWLKEVNKYRKANTLSAFTDRAFIVNSAYRNPYHQRFHVNASQGKTASFHSRHCYGDALDIETLDVDGDSTVEQMVGNKAASDDGVLMELRALDAGALWTASWEYYSTHTHADWTSRRSWPPPPGTVYSPPCEMPKDRATTSQSSSSSGQVRGACGEHTIAASEASQHAERTGACGHTYYSCQQAEHQLLSCPTDQGRTCEHQTYYACSPHTHAYAGEALRPCGHPMTASGDHRVTRFSSCGHYGYVCDTSHQSTRCPLGPNGETCSVSGGLYLPCSAASHTHTYPRGSPPKPPQTQQPPDTQTPRETQQPTVAYHPCGVHAATESGDHSLQARCTTDSRCIATDFYSCRHSSHTYSDPPPVPVVCPADSRTNCGGPVSHATRCGQGHTYYTCSASDVLQHSGHTQNDDSNDDSNDDNNDDSDDDNNDDSDDTDTAPSAPPVPTPNPPSDRKEACGIHRYGSRGNHSLVACPTNASGQNCTVGSYYACQTHTHSYPAVDPPRPCGHSQSSGGNHSLVSCPTNASGQNCTVGTYYVCRRHTHKYPALPVVCPADRWTNCGGTSSHATMCAADHEYYTCNPDAVRAHAGHTAARPCGHSQSASGNHSWRTCPTNASGQNCTAGGAYVCQRHSHSYPSPPSRRPCGHSQSSGGNHSKVSCPSGTTCSPAYAYACQSHTHTYDSSENNSSSNTTRVKKIYCSGCRQVVSSASAHRTTCGQGHSYYRCNAYAVRLHSGHSSSSNNSSTNNSSGNNSSSNNSSSNNSSSNNSSSNNSSSNNSSSNNSSSNNSSSNNIARIVCPANRWTRCGGTTSHATRCRRGHIYYTCNPRAVSAHKWH